MKKVNKLRNFVVRKIKICALLVCMVGGLSTAWAAQPVAFGSGSWTLVVLPDTQRYTDPKCDPGMKTFDTITQWVADNKKSHNIGFVLHEGDITSGNTAVAWRAASAAMSILDKAGVPYSLATGNHDFDQWEPKFQHSPGRDTLLNDHFSVARYKKMPTFGGPFEPGKTQNIYHLFTAGGKDYIAISLEWGPRDEAVTWADAVLKKYPQRSAMIVTHVYTYSDGTRYDWAAKGTKQIYSPHCKSYSFSTPHDGSENVNDGQQLWEKLVSKNKNVIMVLSGHLPWGAARQKSVGEHGQVVHEMMAAYHDPYDGGPTTGYIRLLEFLPDGRTVRVKTYSPKLDKYLTDDANQFTLQLKPAK